MGMDGWYRSAVLRAADRKQVRRVLESRGMGWGVKRFVAGYSLQEASEQVRRLQDQGLLVTLDLLGESVSERAQADEVCRAILYMQDEIHRLGLQANVSLKLSQLGLLIDEALCAEQMEQIVRRAAALGQFIRIDMEDSSLTAPTLELFEVLLRRYGSGHIGAVIQSYLRRSEEDVDRLTKLGANLRIVKGAYREPPAIAYPDKKDVDAAYLRLVQLCLDRGTYVAAATHDIRLIREIIRRIHSSGTARDRFEFQMLYGIAGALQRQLAGEGYRVRIYTPYGEQWYPYFSRRIAERPANLWFVLKSLLRP